MAIRTTEELHPKAVGLDARPLDEVAAILGEGQIAASSAVRRAIKSICGGANAMAGTIRQGGILHYVAAGSSGLMAAADALELGGTFSIPSSQIKIHMAGGMPTSAEMPGNTEDETESLNGALANLSSDDVVIAVSASGTTPYTITAASIAKRAGTPIIGIANNAGSELLLIADHAITLETPPEVIAGSTRMGAATAQKIALNMLSTLMAVQLGHVHDGMMVNLYADNIKLRGRARGIVSKVADVSDSDADHALEQTSGDVKSAILMACGATNVDAATELIARNGGQIRPALKILNQSS